MLSSAIYSDGFVGHVSIIDKLQSLIEKGTLPHALLFCGFDGIGKQRAAGWVAAAYLCPSRGCGECSTCRRVVSGLHPDFHRMEPETGRRDILIGQVRELTSVIATKPFEADGKAVVINDSERMNEESQNAFLKTLEEPPRKTVIILISSAPDRLLPTIRSRCQRFSFGRLSEKEIEQFLTRQEDLNQKGLNTEIPLTLAKGSPGRLLRYIRDDVGRARTIWIDFITSSAPLSPVRSTMEMMDWAAHEADFRQMTREKLRQGLELGAGILRDLLVLKEGSEGRQLINRDFEKKIRDAAIYYERAGLYHAIQGMVETAEDIASYVDPGLAIEKVFRVIRDVRKRG